jgi:DNA-binding NarL/FixJ family response regulator
MRREADVVAVVLVEDDDRIRMALQYILDGSPGVVCTGAYADAESLLGAKNPPRFDVVLLDIGLPGMSGIDAIKPIRERWPRAEILMQTVYQEENQVFEALCAGATGYLLKNTPPTQLVDAICEVHSGGAPMTASIARKVIRFFRRPDYHEEVLTERENEVLDKLIEGKTNRQIAAELFISDNTVAFHLKQIYEKLHVHSRAEAVAKAMKRRRTR